jgi:hypothetical protein
MSFKKNKGLPLLDQVAKGKARGQVALPNRRPVPVWDRPGLTLPVKRPVFGL